MTDNKTPSGQTPQPQSANTQPEESGQAQESQSSDQQQEATRITPEKDSGAEQQPPQSPATPPQPQLVAITPAVLAQLAAGAQRQALPYAAGLVQTQMQVWQSQYPPPDAAERYEKILPGSFDRIIGMAERLQAAQIDTTQRAQNYAMRDTRRAHWLGWSIAFLAMLGAFGCMLLNYPWWLAAAFLSVPVMGVAKALIETAAPRSQTQLPPQIPPTPPPSPPKK
jgi:uncharacterized membrane protein